jgi:NAD(P)-dependent dehydrogenase (short-subunit alcohol dehydrogenase family)
MSPPAMPFDSNSTASDVIEGIDLGGKRAIITGGASGIGIETARAIAAAGAEVTLAVRHTQAAEDVAAELRASTGNPSIHVRALDLASSASVRTFIDEWHGPLHILINNAGVMALPVRALTSERIEMQLATNFLGHFSLTTGLHRSLASAAGARVVCVSSSAHLLAPLFFDDPNFDFIPYDPLLAYAQSKTACISFAVEGARRWNDDGIHVNALNPGAIATHLQRHTGGLRTPKDRQKTPAQGAATSVLFAASPTVHGVTGKYYENCRPATVVHARPSDYTGVAAYAIDEENARRLWHTATTWVQQK